MEPSATIVPPGDLPRVDDDPPMPSAQFDALVRAARWSAMTPFMEPQGTDRAEAPIASPAFGAVQVDDFQIEPLLRALQMPRVSLLLADDVGLGKTIEAGLILTELLLRRRIRRVLVLCPAALRTQWQQEMADKFSLTFDPVDRDATHALQKRLGLDANPWRTFPRIIAPYHYLRQPEVLEAFLATCRARDDRAGAEVRLPWDLLIVDEAHNLMPSSFGSDSDLAKMLRAISPWFEHKLFLTATPHNGHTRSFTGLLEQLDPVRFTQTHEVTDAERTRISQVVVRRLKSEINALDDAAGRTRRFSSRNLDPLPLFFGKREQVLNTAVEELRREIKRIIATWPDEAGRAGHFAIEVLAKRLLSSPSTFAHSWFRFRRGIAGDEAAEAREVDAARRASKTELDDDAELEGRQRHAARVIGAWLQPHADSLTDEMQAIDDALDRLGIEPRHEDDEAQYHVTAPSADARFERLKKLIGEKLRSDREWRADERLIVFTEYKATLDDLDRRLRDEYPDAAERLLTLYGGLDPLDRDRIKDAFNDPDHSVRILLATDAASEGLNLQNTARYVLHYEVPWNPARLEQRNGRLDRHGQARDVTVFHFTSENDADLRFIERVVQKVHDMRTDLGSLSEIFDAAFERRFLDFADDRELDKQIDADAEKARKTADVPRAATEDTQAHIERVQRMRRAADLTPDTLRSTLAVALGLGAPGAEAVLDGPDAEGRFRLNVNALPQPWQRLVDDSLRLRDGALASAMPGLVFDPQWFVRPIGEAGRPVFRPRPDTVLLHLGHPVFHRALATLARARFPQDGDLRASRWIARRGPVPEGAEGLVLLTVEEMAVNDLRETFHHVVTTWQIPLMADGIGEPLDYIHPIDDPSDPALLEGDALDDAQELYLAATRELRGFTRDLAKTRTQALKKLLTATRNRALKTEKKRFKDRIGEVRKAMKSTTLARLQKQIDRERARQSQMMIPGVDRRAEEAKLRDLEAELALRRKHYDELLDRLEREQTRVVEQAVPRRHTLAGEVRILPVTVEIRLPREATR